MATALLQQCVAEGVIGVVQDVGSLGPHPPFHHSLQ